MKVVTAVVNNPVFIEIQYHTLQKYLKGEQYEFIVFNDAKAFPDFTNDGDVTVRTKIAETCQSLGIQCISLLNEHHREMTSAAERCADAMKAILHYQLEQPVDKYLLLDSDMFLIDYFDINKYSEYDCAIVLQSRQIRQTINYFWNGIYYFDMMKMKNKELLNWNCSPHCDVGGMMQGWLKTQMRNTTIPNTDEVRWTNKEFHTNDIYFIKHLWSCSWNINELPKNLESNTELINFFKNDPRNSNGNFFCEIYDNVFLHYRAGGNWRNEGLELHNLLSQELKKILLF
jgi:hypothetical protein